jgi:hypothetical protein
MPWISGTTIGHMSDNAGAGAKITCGNQQCHKKNQHKGPPPHHAPLEPGTGEGREERIFRLV